jgi:predicted enzyme related to lactoylglutathione lyase
MPAPLAHIAINADDVAASRAFYAAVLGWSFTPWGPPGFHHIHGPGLRAAALQPRRELVPGVRITGPECTFAVDDPAATERAAVAAGGRVLAETVTIPGVGDLAWLADPAGNVLGAMRYD